MEDISKTEKKNLKRKFREFRKTGLEAYRKYLEKELESASKSDIKKAYKKYIEKELTDNAKRIEKINAKLGL